MKDSSKRVVTLVLLGWLCFGVGVSGWFYNASAQVVAATVWTLTVLALVVCWKISPIRVWALHVDLRWLVLFHVTRLVAGAYFLLLVSAADCHASLQGQRVGATSLSQFWRWLWSARCALTLRSYFCLPGTHLDLLTSYLLSLARSGLAYKTGIRCTRYGDFHSVFSRRFWCRSLSCYTF